MLFHYSGVFAVDLEKGFAHMNNFKAINARTAHRYSTE